MPKTPEIGPHLWSFAPPYQKYRVGNHLVGYGPQQEILLCRYPPQPLNREITVQGRWYEIDLGTGDLRNTQGAAVEQVSRNIVIDIAYWFEGSPLLDDYTE